MKNSNSTLNKFRQAGKIKVLFCINSLAGGGAEKVLIDILKRFDYEKYCVDLLLIVHSGVYLNDVPREVLLLTFEDVDYLANMRYDVEIAFLEGWAVRYIAHKKSDAWKIAWVHTDLLKYHWTKTIVYNGDDEEEEADFSRMDKIVFVSKDSLGQFNKLFPEIRVPQTVIYNLIDANNIRNRSRVFQVEKRKLTMCCMGRLTWLKAYPRLLSVINRLIHEDGFEFDLWIIGEGELRLELEALIEQYSLKDIVFLKGFHKNPHPYMKAADLYLLPSHMEGFPLVLAEALCLGKPILATECTGSREMLDSGAYGMMVENDEDAIYHGLRKMIEDESLREEYARKALPRAEMFDVDKTMKEIYKLLPNPITNTDMDLNERILNHVILASAASRNPGLLDGKMGIILFLMLYAKASGNVVYKEIAEDILDELWTEVDMATPIGFAAGLCGIGWGIEYLIQNGLVEGNANDICEDIDKAVRLLKIHPEMERSLDTGLEGTLHYIMARIGGSKSADCPVPFEAAFLEELYGITKNKRAGIFAMFNRFYTGSIYEYQLNIADFIPSSIRVKKTLSENQLGLRGLTGYLFKQLI